MGCEASTLRVKGHPPIFVFSSAGGGADAYGIRSPISGPRCHLKLKSGLFAIESWTCFQLKAGLL